VFEFGQPPLGVENPAPVGTTIGKDYRPLADHKPEKLTPIQINIPPALNKQLARACFEQGCTKTYLIIKALAGEGFEVDPVYLSPDRRKPKG
jgi:hypothetical protein